MLLRVVVFSKEFRNAKILFYSQNLYCNIGKPR